MVTEKQLCDFENWLRHEAQSASQHGSYGDAAWMAEELCDAARKMRENVGDRTRTLSLLYQAAAELLEAEILTDGNFALRMNVRRGKARLENPIFGYIR